MIRLIVCGLAGLLVVSTFSQAADVDNSDPKAVALAFAKAIENGDAATARQLVVGTDQEKQFVDSTVAFIGARKKLKDSAVKAFADKAADLADLRGNMSDQIPNMDVQIDGDNATLIPPKSQPDGKPFPLTKIDGKWKVKLSALLSESSTQPSESSQQNLAEIQSTLNTWTTSINELATEIDQGKYKTADDAKAALAAKAQAAATRPTTAPAQ
jgi:hypothetical protein